MFTHFRDSYEAAFQRKYGKLTSTAKINIQETGLEYVHLMRLQTKQMKTNSPVPQARQHPSIQLRAWLQAAELQGCDIEVAKKPEDEQSTMRAAFLKLSSSN